MIKEGKKRKRERERRWEVTIGGRTTGHGKGKEGELFVPWKVGLTDSLTDLTKD